MPLVAIGPKGPVFALAAEPNVLYYCACCKLPVKLRGGKYVRHFYHLRTTPQCRLYSRSEDHLFLQWSLHSLFSAQEVELEAPFLDIQRVADVCWHARKIAFEIQCSPISLREAKKRVADYAREGYRVVWLLDDRLFNRKKVLPAEEWIRAQNGFYASLSRSPFRCFYYDQFEIVLGGRREKKSRPYKIALNRVYLPKNPSWPKILPTSLRKKIGAKPLVFHGDLLNLSLRGLISNHLLFQWAFQERLIKKEKSFHWTRLFVENFLHRYQQWLIQAHKNF